MQLKTIKTSQELRTALLQPQQGDANNFAELIFKDKSVIGARIGTVHFKVASYNFEASVEVPFEEAKRYRVEVKHPNFETVIRFFENDYEANEFMCSYDNISDAEVIKEQVTVQLDDSGNIVDLGAAPISLDQEVPF